MSSRRFTSICTSWTQRREVLLLVRSLSESATHDEVTLSELAEKPVASTTEPNFGIPPRKLGNVEDEDFVPSSTFSRPQDASLAPSHQNYFSQTWAEQKQGSLLRGSHLLNEQSQELVSPGPSIHNSSPTTSRVWLVAPDLQASSQETFTFTSFKVLASHVAQKHKGHLFKHVPWWMLAWKSRSRKILSGLELCTADIICLQEVDRFSELQSELSRKGYVGLYKASTGTEPSGCAMFWREGRFHLLHEESLEFRSRGLKDNVAQLCVLQSSVPGIPNMGATLNSRNEDLSERKCLVVGNIDVLFNPKRGHIKLGQCRAFLQQAHKLATLWPSAPLIIGGCFHATPQSTVYDFLANSRLDVHGLKCQHLSGQLPIPASPVRNVANHSGTSSGKGEPSSEFRDRLRKALLGKFASKQEIHAVDFANATKELLSSTPSNVGPTASVSSERHIHKTEPTSVKKFVSKTIEVLESCNYNSKRALSSMDINVSGVDVAPSMSEVMDTGTQLANASTSSEFGSKIEPPSKRWSEAPVQKSLYGVDKALTEPCDMQSTACAEVLRDKEAAVSTLPASTVKTNIDQDPCANLPGHAALGHGWDPEELELATGSSDNTVAKHELKLFSVYPEIPGNSKTRDHMGEPLVTMCHSEFRGAVDYIWRSKGLKTKKVLDTFPLTDIVAIPALPFMACGSDHVNLACELAFTSQEH